MLARVPTRSLQGLADGPPMVVALRERGQPRACDAREEEGQPPPLPLDQPTPLHSPASCRPCWSCSSRLCPCSSRRPVCMPNPCLRLPSSPDRNPGQCRSAPISKLVLGSRPELPRFLCEPPLSMFWIAARDRRSGNSGNTNTLKTSPDSGMTKLARICSTACTGTYLPASLSLAPLSAAVTASRWWRWPHTHTSPINTECRNRPPSSILESRMMLLGVFPIWSAIACSRSVLLARPSLGISR